jgi:hypothetical protein
VSSVLSEPVLFDHEDWGLRASRMSAASRDWKPSARWCPKRSLRNPRDQHIPVVQIGIPEGAQLPESHLG